MSSLAQIRLSDDDNEKFLIRWRGRQEGPYTATVLEAKLAANQIGLLHEIHHGNRWQTIRDFLVERESALRAALQAQAEQEQRARDEAEKRARDRDEKIRQDMLAEERRKNALLEASLSGRHDGETSRSAAPVAPLRPHRGGTILTLGILGLLVLFPLGIAAWVMGSGDLREMDAHIMDNSGRSSTSAGRTLGMITTLLWAAFLAAILFLPGFPSPFDR